jgi:hypothetical protein
MTQAELEQQINKSLQTLTMAQLSYIRIGPYQCVFQQAEDNVGRNAA